MRGKGFGSSNPLGTTSKYDAKDAKAQNAQLVADAVVARALRPLSHRANLSLYLTLYRTVRTVAVACCRCSVLSL